MNELKFIKYLTKNIKHGKDVVVGVGDDAAVIKYTSGKYLLFASDMLIEGAHFTKNTNPEKIGRKAVAVNISDIAAMGGVPKYVVISGGAPNISMLKGVLEGARKICNKFGVNIVGGDTNKSKKLVIDAAIIGEVEKKNLVLRSGAKVKDFIFITGSLGKGKRTHLDFMPRVKESRMLVKNFKINSMIDVSDGLFLDLTRLCGASKAGAFIREDLIPGSGNSINYGEDFELLFTVSRKEAGRLMKKKDPPAALIGEIVSKEKGISLVNRNGRITEIKEKGYVHFK